MGLVAGLCLLVACSTTQDDPLSKIRTLQDEGQVEETIEPLIELIEAGNRDGETLFRYGRALSFTRRPGRAVWALDAAMNDPEWIVPAAHQLAMDNYQGGNFEIVVDILDRLERERPDPETDDVFALMLRGRALLGTRQDYEPALEVFETILDIAPDNEEALRLKGVALLGLKRVDEAYELIQAGSELAQEDDLGLGASSREAYWCSIRASFKREDGKLDEAEEILDPCLEANPTATSLLNEAGKLYGRPERQDKLLAVMTAAYEAAPENRELKMVLVLQYRALGRRDEAEAILRGALDAPTPEAAAEGWVDLAGFLIDGEQVDEGLDAYEQAMSMLEGTLAPELLFSYGEALILAKRYDDALAIADKTPIEVHGPMLRGRVAYEREQYAKAIENLDEAARLWPDNGAVRYYLARAAEGLGDFDRAIEEYRQAIRSDPGLHAARERLVALHLAEGNTRHAISILQFASPEAGATATLEARLLEIQIRAQLGQDPKLGQFPGDQKHSIEELRKLSVHALAEGLKMRSGPEPVVAVLADMAKEAEPDVKDILVIEQVDLLLASGKADEAVALIRPRTEIRPDRDDLRLALARALVGVTPTSDEAEGLLTRLVERQPENAVARSTLAQVNAAKGNLEQALAFFDRALETDPALHDAAIGRFDVLIQLDQRDEAVAGLERYLAREAPYDGPAALRLAQLTPPADEPAIQQIQLARRALRFGGGQPALELLVEIDPNVVVEQTSPTPESAPGETEASEPAANGAS